MRSVIIFCHPCTDSFNAALLASARAAFSKAGHEQRLIDLYADGFNPILSATEKRDYLPNTGAILENVAPYVEAIRWAEQLVFIFPTWFYGPPAMLKGWFERVWLPGVAFKVPDKPGGKAGPGMQHIVRLTVITTSGSPWWWLKLIRDPCRSFFTRGLRALFSPRCKTIYLQLHGMNTSTLAQREAFIKKIHTTLSKS